MRALDVGSDAAVGSVHDDEIECDRAAVIVKGRQNHECSDNLRHRGARFICGSPYRTLAHELPLTEEKPENRMRELFDEVSGKSPLDPEEAVRRTTRGPRRKRFYANAGVIEARDGFAITLDDKPVRTPSGRALVAPAREIADAISAEWDA